MNKEQLIIAINGLLDGDEEQSYYDELVTLLSLVSNVSDESIAAAYSEVHFSEDEKGDEAREEE
jgi:hypothetical protein